MSRAKRQYSTYYARLILDEAYYLVNNQTTIRACSKEFNRPRSTIHNELHTVLPVIDPKLYAKVAKLFKYNIAHCTQRAADAHRRNCLLRKDNSVGGV